MFNTEEYREKFNREAKTWLKITKTDLIQQINSLDLSTQLDLLQKSRADGNRKPLADSLRTGTRKNFGIIDTFRVGFSINGMFLDRGVGRGTKISQVVSTEREPKQWIDVVMDLRTELLADITAENFGDDFVESIKFNKK